MFTDSPCAIRKSNCYALLPYPLVLQTVPSSIKFCLGVEIKRKTLLSFPQTKLSRKSLNILIAIHSVTWPKHNPITMLDTNAYIPTSTRLSFCTWHSFTLIVYLRAPSWVPTHIFHHCIKINREFVSTFLKYQKLTTYE